MTHRLLAKSYPGMGRPGAPPEYALLTRHSRDVASACRALLHVVGGRALEVMGLDSRHASRLQRALELNGWVQDLGKANNQFQDMVTRAPEVTQLLRHETLSTLLLWREPALREWLAPLDDVLLLALWGAAGHHRKFDEDTVPTQAAPQTLAIHHRDFKELLGHMGAWLGLHSPPEWERPLRVGRTLRDGGEVAALPALREMMLEFQEAEPRFAPAEERRLLALVKSLGIAADVAASALARSASGGSSEEIAASIERELAVGLTPGELSQLIAAWAWARSASPASGERPAGLPPDFELRPFQTQVAGSESFLTLAEAGCGSGKSLAAYLWARAWCERRQARDAGAFRLFVCLPTTGTTTEHFRDYALESGIPASLAHSRAMVDLRTLAGTVPQEEADGGAQAAAAQALLAERQKLEALALWSSPLVVTTADTVLGALVCGRKSLCALPSVLQAAIVFDEVHAFDDQLFGHLLVFLHHFPRLPVLLMTASLPESRRAAIAAIRPDLVRIGGPEGLEALPRYRLALIQDEVAAWSEVESCLKNDGKVLWVRNRVDWANTTYRAARARFPHASVHVYHSRFRYRDRSERHRRVIDSFKGAARRPTLLVSTQVAEMSLDLSADLLVTDVAPIPSLIQRLGRLNRRATPEAPGEPCPALICAGAAQQPSLAMPYTPAELGEALEWARALCATAAPLSQRDLSDAFARFSRPEVLDFSAAEERACLFGVPGRSGLWRTRPGQTRGDGTTMSVLLEKDVRECTERDAQGQPHREWVRSHEVAIPFKPQALRWQRAAGLPVAPEGEVTYDFDKDTGEGTGARWRGN